MVWKREFVHTQRTPLGYAGCYKMMSTTHQNSLFKPWKTKQDHSNQNVKLAISTNKRYGYQRNINDIEHSEKL